MKFLRCLGWLIGQAAGTLGVHHRCARTPCHCQRALWKDKRCDLTRLFGYFPTGFVLRKAHHVGERQRASVDTRRASRVYSHNISIAYNLITAVHTTQEVLRYLPLARRCSSRLVAWSTMQRNPGTHVQSRVYAQLRTRLTETLDTRRTQLTIVQSPAEICRAAEKSCAKMREAFRAPCHVAAPVHRRY